MGGLGHGHDIGDTARFEVVTQGGVLAELLVGGEPRERHPAARAASIISLTWAGLVLKVRSGGTPAAAQRARAKRKVVLAAHEVF